MLPDVAPEAAATGSGGSTAPAIRLVAPRAEK
jgi:hypothetical protein